MRQHIVNQRETLGSIAKIYTGDPRRSTELLVSNPSIARSMGSVGSFRKVFHKGTRLQLPQSWGTVGATLQTGSGSQTGLSKAEPSGSSTTSCSPGIIHDVKDYRFLIKEGYWPTTIADEWFGGQDTNLHASEMLKANHDFKRGFSQTSYGCNFSGLFAGDILKVPASWPDPPASLKDYIINPDGTPYTPGGGGGQGGNGLNPASWGLSEGTPTWLWVVLGVGGAVGLGLLASGALKSKKTGKAAG